MAAERARPNQATGHVRVIDRVAAHQRIEPLVWAMAARACVRVLPWKATQDLFDRLPVGEFRGDVVVMPAEWNFRGAGACLARTLARSQYLRRRGVSNTIVIGATGQSREMFSLDAHAWLESFDDSPTHAVLHRIAR